MGTSLSVAAAIILVDCPRDEKIILEGLSLDMAPRVDGIKITMNIKMERGKDSLKVNAGQQKRLSAWFLSEEDRARYLELVNAGRIVAVLGWVDGILLNCPSFSPVADEIQRRAMQLDFEGLRHLVDLFGGSTTGTL